MSIWASASSAETNRRRQPPGAQHRGAESVRRSVLMWIPGAEALNRGARFVVVALLARELGAQGYGSWVYAAALAMIVANGSDLGLTTVLTTRIARAPDDARRYIATTVALIPLLALGPALALLFVAAVFARDAAVLLLLLGAAGVCDSVGYLLLAPLRAIGKMLPEAATRGAQGLVLLAASPPLLLVGHRGAVAIAALFLAVSTMALAAGVCGLVVTFGLPRPRLHRDVAGRLIGDALPLFFAVVVTLVYFRADALVISALRGPRDTGLYAAAYNIAFGCSFLPLMFQRVLLPGMAAADTPHALRVAYAGAMRQVGAIAVALCAVLAAFTPLLPRIYGSDFEGSQSTYLLLLPAFGLYFLTYINYTLLLARGRNAAALWLTVLALAVNLSANFALIPALGANGAALAACASEGVLLAAQLPLVRGLLLSPAEAGEPARAELAQRETDRLAA